MTMNRWLVFALAFVVWAALFYAMDRFIMEAQGLPVGADLMPI